MSQIPRATYLPDNINDKDFAKLIAPLIYKEWIDLSKNESREELIKRVEKYTVDYFNDVRQKRMKNPYYFPCKRIDWFY